MLNVVEIVFGVEKFLSTYQTRPSPSHDSGDHGRSSGFYSYGNIRSGNWSHNRLFSAYNHGGLKFSHRKLPKEAITRGVNRENLHQNHIYFYYPSMPTDPHQSMPPHLHHNMPHHLFPSISTNHIFPVHISLLPLCMHIM